MAGTLKLVFQKGRLVRSEVNGVQGPDCLKETKKFLDGLRIDPNDFEDKHTPEFDLPSFQNETQGQGGS